MGIVVVGGSILVRLGLVEGCRYDDQLVEVAKVVQQQGLGQLEMHQRDEAVCGAATCLHVQPCTGCHW